MIPRLIEPVVAASRKSCLLLGPRQVGKSTLLASLKPDLTIQLADEEEYLRYASLPSAFKSDIVESGASTVFIDEIQRLPSLLNTIQSLVDTRPRLKFLLSGSSARKLKRGQANLLPGRIGQFYLGPLVSAEVGHQMNTRNALETGTLPGIYLSEDVAEKQRVLRTYAATYLKEEVKAEALVRKLDAFSRFLHEVSLEVGQFIDLTKLARRSKVSRHSLPSYFEILEDTLVGHRLYSFGAVRDDVDLVKHPKFFFFDNGVLNGLWGNFVASPDRIGRLAEQLIFSQLWHSGWAREKELRLSTFRMRSGIEVDFVVEMDDRCFGIEVKASEDVMPDELEGLRRFEKACLRKPELFVFHLGTRERKWGSIRSLPWQKGLKALGL